MRLRWSNGQSAAVEFDVPSRQRMQDALCDGLIEYRRRYKEHRVELHVQASPDHWTDPVLSIPAVDCGSLGTRTAGYGHVINCASRVQPDADGDPPKVRGTDYVLIVGPGAWHADELYMGCMAAIGHTNRLTGLVADVVDAVQEGDKQP